MQRLLLDADEHASAIDDIQTFQARYLDSLEDRGVFSVPDRTTLRRLMDTPMPGDGSSFSDVLAEFEEIVVANATHTCHPRFLPFVQPSPTGAAPYADFLAALLNQNCNLWKLSPGANAVEQQVLGWFAAHFGLPRTCGGILMSGGSMANVIGLATALSARLGPDARTKGLQGQTQRLIVYTSEETHSSIDKAISMLGLGTDNLRKLPTDSQFRLPPDALRRAIAADRTKGYDPFCVVANAGTVTTGAFDPIPDIAGVCAEHGLWLHVDGAYGALTSLSPRFSHLVEGVELADSLSLDPHKFLFCSFDVGCVLVRERERLRHTFQVAPSYLSLAEDADFLDFASYGPQLSRSFRALKVWWGIKQFGRDAFVSTIEDLCDLAAYMALEIERFPDMELLAPVTLNCVCFRTAGRYEDQFAILDRLVASGLAFLGPASVKGEQGLRACFMNLRTTRDDVDAILDAVRRIASELKDETSVIGQPG